MTVVRRNTWQRETVRTALRGASGFVSAQALHAGLAEGAERVGLATVYRTLNDLVGSGEADALQSTTGETLYRACQPGHHHHLICRSCGAAEEIQAAEVEAWAKAVAAEHGYTEPQHVVDVFGLCAACGNTPSK